MSPHDKTVPSETPSFHDTGLSPELLQGIESLGFKEPTPIQAKVIPLLLKGKRDVVALAQTGTGKTAAFGLPLLQLTDPASPAIQALVLSPTRELCVQIARDISNFGKFSPQLRILAVYGGASIQMQMRALHRGIHILVATPGRLNDLLRRGVVRLDAVRRVVLDEADEMLSMGFKEDIEAILAEVPDDARTLLFSATMPKAVAAIASSYMDDPEEIVVSSKTAGALKIDHVCHVVHARDRYEVLRRILDANPDFFGIIFCRTRVETQELAAGLQADGYPAEPLHGDLSQEQRDRVMRRFRVRAARVLVATDVAARGLDVHDVTHVIHFDLPGDPDVYTHRSGRTGRAGKSGVSIVLAHMREEGKIRMIERVTKRPFEHKPPPDVRDILRARMEHLLAGIKAAPGKPEDLEAFRGAIEEGFRDLTREQVIDLMLLREFGPLLERYRAAPPLDTHRAPARRNGPPPPHFREPASESHHHDAPFFAVRVNVGRRNGLTPAGLIGMINRATPGPMLPLGQIRIFDTDSIFEIPGNAADLIMKNLNQMVIQKRQIRAVPSA